MNMKEAEFRNDLFVKTDYQTPLGEIPQGGRAQLLEDIWDAITKDIPGYSSKNPAYNSDMQ